MIGDQLCSVSRSVLFKGYLWINFLIFLVTNRDGTNMNIPDVEHFLANAPEPLVAGGKRCFFCFKFFISNLFSRFR